MNELAALAFDASMLAMAVPARFQYVVAHVTPEHLAYVDQEVALTYRELDRTSNVLASCLQARGKYIEIGRAHV